jgi:hypothetical protein
VYFIIKILVSKMRFFRSVFEEALRRRQDLPEHRGRRGRVHLHQRLPWRERPPQNGTLFRRAKKHRLMLFSLGLHQPEHNLELGLRGVQDALLVRQEDGAVRGPTAQASAHRVLRRVQADAGEKNVSNTAKKQPYVD